MTKRFFLILGVALSFVLVANSQTRVRKKPAPPPKPVSAGAIKTPSGLTYVITQKGTGRLPKVGETVVVHYTGTLTNGVKFDSSRDGGKPLSFPLGRGRVIKGWDEGIGKMRIGDHAILIIPPSIGYGARGAGGGVVPPNATMIFIVELVDIQ
jgi:peptidylprolyl isomerase